MRKLVAVFHNIRSVHNVGSMFRTADAAGVEKLYLTGITPSPLDRLGRPRKDFIKVSLGAESAVPWDDSFRSPRAIQKLFARLADDGYALVAVEQSPRSIPYNVLPKTKKIQKIALVMGNEVDGLPPFVLKRAGKVLEIRMYGKKESLNVSVAFGIVLYSLRS